MARRYEVLYEPDGVSGEFRPIFEQLGREFGIGYEIRTQTEDFGRWRSAVVVKQSSGTRARVELFW